MICTDRIACPELVNSGHLGLIAIRYITMKIFLSHQSKNKPLVREFKGKLPAFLNTWLDEESLIWGDSLPQELRLTIQSSVDFLIIFLDEAALDSAWVMKELRWAIEREAELGRTFVLPIFLEDLDAEKLPTGFVERLHLRLAGYDHASVESLARIASDSLFQLIAKSFSAVQLELPPPIVHDPYPVPDLRGIWRISRASGDGSLIDEGPVEIEQNGNEVIGKHMDSVSGRVFKYSGIISSGQVVLTFEEQGGEGYIIGTMIFKVDSQRKKMSGRSLYWRHDDNRMDGEDYVAIRELPEWSPGNGTEL